jgi:hypothetical protein
MQLILFQNGRILQGAELATISDIRKNDELECAGDFTVNSGQDPKDDPEYIFSTWMQFRGGTSTTERRSETEVDGSHPLRLVRPDKELFDNYG